VVRPEYAASKGDQTQRRLLLRREVQSVHQSSTQNHGQSKVRRAAKQTLRVLSVYEGRAECIRTADASPSPSLTSSSYITKAECIPTYTYQMRQSKSQDLLSRPSRKSKYARPGFDPSSPSTAMDDATLPKTGTICVRKLATLESDHKVTPLRILRDSQRPTISK